MPNTRSLSRPSPRQKGRKHEDNSPPHRVSQALGFRLLSAAGFPRFRDLRRLSGRLRISSRAETESRDRGARSQEERRPLGFRASVGLKRLSFGSPCGSGISARWGLPCLTVQGVGGRSSHPNICLTRIAWGTFFKSMGPRKNPDSESYRLSDEAEPGFIEKFHLLTSALANRYHDGDLR